MNKVIIVKNRYVDSVSLMSVSDMLIKMPGISNAEAGMATRANIEALIGMGYQITDEVNPNDLLLAFTGDGEESIDAVIKRSKELLNQSSGRDSTAVYKSIDDINLFEDSYDLVQISLPGEYAKAEALIALEKGMDVFMFSDNVSLSEELEMKKLAIEKDLLMMGPDCGVGLIDGVALGAGSIVTKGEIGIVAASGSGAQEVACIIEKLGSGVSNLIGTGGRDLYPEIGGRMMKQGMMRMERDKNTRVIVLVSKLADISVMENILTLADRLTKPVVAVFLGSDESLFHNHKVKGVFSLEAAAIEAVKLCMDEEVTFGYKDEEIDKITKDELKKYTKEQKYFRGLYCGGTFTEESMIYFHEHNKDTVMYSNLDTKYAKKLETHLDSYKNTILDLVAEDFTYDTPHPVFDPAIRMKRLYEELKDPEVAVVLIDFITGPGVHEDPFTPVIDIYKKIKKEKERHVTFLASICGSKEDPQNVEEKEKLLADAGIIVSGSNYQNTRLASALIAGLEGRA